MAGQSYQFTTLIPLTASSKPYALSCLERLWAFLTETKGWYLLERNILKLAVAMQTDQQLELVQPRNHRNTSQHPTDIRKEQKKIIFSLLLWQQLNQHTFPHNYTNDLIDIHIKTHKRHLKCNSPQRGLVAFRLYKLGDIFVFSL